MQKIAKNNYDKKQVLCLAAGGSGGHILPALELAKQWHTANPEGSVVFFSSNKKLDQKILAEYSFISSIITISFDKFVPSKLWLYPQWFIQGAKSIVTSYRELAKLEPEKVISTGGLIAIPVIIAAWIHNFRFFKQKIIKNPFALSVSKGLKNGPQISIELYELNVIPGKAIKFLSPFATKIYVIFSKTTSLFKVLGKDFGYKCALHAYPLRFKQDDLEGSRNDLIAQLNEPALSNNLTLDPERTTIFVLGGSQGSLLLNTLIKNLIEQNSTYSQEIQVIHQTGANDKTDWKEFYAKHSIPAITFSYHHNIKDFYLISDLVICRAGAGTLFELLFFKKRSIVIPLVARSTDHQVDNAREMAKEHPELFTVIEQKIAETNHAILFDAIQKNSRIA